MVERDSRATILAALRETGDATAAAEAVGLSADELIGQIRADFGARATLGAPEVRTRVRHGAEILRDRRGVPHIYADDPYDLFFAFGYAQAQDRLWQLDYLRRLAYGRLSEVFGAHTLESDILSRTLQIGRLAQQQLDYASAEGRDARGAFADGVNAWMENLPGGLPIEFELLGYEPQPWQPLDSLAIQARWWWYLTGRLHVLYTPELVRAGLGDGTLYDAFYAPDGPLAYIVPPGAYDPTPSWPEGLAADPPRAPLGGAPDAVGSNNWVVDPTRSATGRALLASDPHVFYVLPAEWYEAHLCGAGIDMMGIGYPAMPGILIGRNRQVAWGITNNICSLRDLFLEEVDGTTPAQYRRDGAWKPLDQIEERIEIADAQPHVLTLQSTDHGPLVDHLVPPLARPAGLWPEDTSGEKRLALRWVGFEPSDEAQSLFELARSSNVDEARAAFREWRCPTWNYVFADSQGQIGYQAIGAIPLRGRERRGFRDGDDPRDQWRGSIPFDGLPRLDRPARGWIASANNHTAPPDFPYPLAGTWSPDGRAPRVEQLLAERATHDPQSFQRIQTDVRSGRAERALPGLLAALGEPNDPLAAAAVEALRTWDLRLTPDSAAGLIFNVFFWRWDMRVVRARFGAERAPLVDGAGWGLAVQLLDDDPLGWFPAGTRISEIREAFAEALAWLRERMGDAVDGWKWGALHVLGVQHPAARTPLQHALLDLPPRPHQGGNGTVASAFYSAYVEQGRFATRLGANYRLVADLGPDAATWVSAYPGQSGQPGSPHYADQVDTYLADGFVRAPFSRAEVEAEAETRTRLAPN